MLIIDDVLISDEVLESYFICHLDKCKGACCYEGDFGAPIENVEKKSIEDPASYGKNITSRANGTHSATWGHYIL